MENGVNKMGKVGLELEEFFAKSGKSAEKYNIL